MWCDTAATVVVCDRRYLNGLNNIRESRDYVTYNNTRIRHYAACVPTRENDKNNKKKPNLLSIHCLKKINCVCVGRESLTRRVCVCRCGVRVCGYKFKIRPIIIYVYETNEQYNKYAFFCNRGVSFETAEDHLYYYYYYCRRRNIETETALLLSTTKQG